MMRTMIRATQRQRVLASVCTLALCTSLIYAQRLTWIPNPFTPSGGVPETRIVTYGLTNQGILFVRYQQGDYYHTYRWKDNELLKLTPSSNDTITSSATEDGSIVLYIGQHSYFWKPSGLVYVNIPRYAAYCTPSGNVIVGQDYDHGYVPYIWENNTINYLPLLSGYPYGEAKRVTEDSRFVVGSCITSSTIQAVLWTFSNNTYQVQGLGTLGGQESRGGAISEDGAIVALNAQNAAGNWRAAVWRANAASLTELPHLGGDISSVSLYSTEHLGMTSDGQYIVGYSYTSENQRRAVRWTRQADGSYQVEDLNTTYADLLGSDILLHAISISRDGRYIAGVGNHGGELQVFILDTRFCDLPDVTGDGNVDDADLLEVLFKFGSGC